MKADAPVWLHAGDPADHPASIRVRLETDLLTMDEADLAESGSIGHGAQSPSVRRCSRCIPEIQRAGSSPLWRR